MSKSAKKTASILRKTLSNVNFAIATEDEQASNDTFDYLVEMLRRLHTEDNIDIEALVDQALETE